MSKTHFFSQKNDEQYTFHPGKQFHLEWEAEEGPCYLFALSERSAALLRKMLQVFPKFYWVWGIEGPQKEWTVEQWQQWDEIQAFVSETEAALVSGCDIQLMTDAINRLTAAVAGETITVDVDGVETEFDYTETGVVPTMNKAFKTTDLSGLWTLLGLKTPVPSPNQNSIAEILAGILAMASGQTGALLTVAEAVRNNQTLININNTTDCGGGSCDSTANGKSNNGTITLTDEGVNIQIEQPDTPLLTAPDT